MTKPRYRLAVDAALEAGGSVTLVGNAAHYLANVVRLKPGDTVALFNRTQGEWCARITEIRKKDITLVVEVCLRVPAARGMDQRPPSARGMELIVCFAPIKGGRLETIIEKATELGASVLQPVITARTIVDKVNLERAETIAREAAEQCERIDWPEIREPVKFNKFLGEWPADVPLIYGDERGQGVSIAQVCMPAHEDALTLNPQEDSDLSQGRGAPAAPLVADSDVEDESTKSRLGAPLPWERSKTSFTFSGEGIHRWGILAGPEGGFTPDEFTALGRVNAAKAVGLGPRILRADTAIITLCVATLMAWGDWHEPPRFAHEGEI